VLQLYFVEASLLLIFGDLNLVLTGDVDELVLKVLGEVALLGQLQRQRLIRPLYLRISHHFQLFRLLSHLLLQLPHLLIEILIGPCKERHLLPQMLILLFQQANLILKLLHLMMRRQCDPTIKCVLDDLDKD